MKKLNEVFCCGILAGCCVLLAACDPAGPGAAGIISLGSEVTAQDFATLEIRAYPDEEGAFDASRIPAEPPARLGLLTSEVTFPYQYEVSEGPNTSPTSRWRMTSWLAREVTGSERPGLDEPFCSVTFDLAECGGTFGDYCSVSGGVDCTLRAP